MDIYAIRQINYKKLLTDFAEKMRREQGTDYGVLDRFGKFADVSPRYLSHVNMGRKNLGDDVSRKFEEAHQLPHGWMDQQHDLSVVVTLGASNPEKEFLRLALSVYRMAPLEAQAMLMRFMVERINSKPAPEPETAGSAWARKGMAESAKSAVG